jgi:hypothetical protein
LAKKASMTLKRGFMAPFFYHKSISTSEPDPSRDWRTACFLNRKVSSNTPRGLFILALTLNKGLSVKSIVTFFAVFCLSLSIHAGENTTSNVDHLRGPLSDFLGTPVLDGEGNRSTLTLKSLASDPSNREKWLYFSWLGAQYSESKNGKMISQGPNGGAYRCGSEVTNVVLQGDRMVVSFKYKRNGKWGGNGGHMLGDVLTALPSVLSSATRGTCELTLLRKFVDGRYIISGLQMVDGPVSAPTSAGEAEFLSNENETSIWQIRESDINLAIVR